MEELIAILNATDPQHLSELSLKDTNLKDSDQNHYEKLRGQKFPKLDTVCLQTASWALTRALLLGGDDAPINHVKNPEWCVPESRILIGPNSIAPNYHRYSGSTMAP